MDKTHLDCKALNCPMPIVRISQTMKKMQLGGLLVVEATDPAFHADVKAWAHRMRQEVVSLEEGECLRATLKKCTP